MKKIYLIIIQCFWVFLTYGQDKFFQNYAPLAAIGKLPLEVRATTESKFDEDIKAIKKESKSNQESKSKKKFSLETNFVLDKLLQSGQVIFNDEVSLYLEKVLAKINEKSKTKIKIYTLRSSAVNAFASPRGEIFVTLGLLAQIENEGQLAFILAHELTHINEKHALELYLDSEGLNKESSNKEVLKRASIDDKVLRKCHYSKELEKKADEGGLKIIQGTNYNLTDLSDVFDVLKYSYLPFDDIKFNPDFLENEHYKIPSSYFPVKVNAINTEDKDDDNKSTHPSITARRTFMMDNLKNKAYPNAKKYLVSETEFNKIRDIARFELPILLLRQESYEEAFYTSYLILQKYPKNLFARKSLAKSLYYHTKYLNQAEKDTQSDTKTTSSDKEEDKKYKPEGEIHAVFQLFEKMKSKEMSILAARNIWNLYLENPKDNELKQLADDILLEIAIHDLKLEQFTSVSKVVSIEKVEENIDKKDKSNKMKKVQQKASSTQQDEYWKTAFDEFINIETFRKSYEESLEKYKERKEDEEYYASDKGKAAYLKDYQSKKKKGIRLGLEKIVVVNPFYLKLDAREKNELEYIKTEKGQFRFNELIVEVARKKNFDIDILDVSKLSETDIAKFNDIRALNEYFSEQGDRNNLSLTPAIEQQKLSDIAKRYGTKYFLWTGIVSLRKTDLAAYGKLAFSIIMPYFLPFAIYDIATPEYDMLQYAILYDVTTGRRSVVKYEYFNHRDTDTVVKAHLFDTFNQIYTK